MSNRFYIVDDDKSVRKILSKIIADNHMGELCGEAGDGTSANRDILAKNPDIVLIDLLLPGVDGITLVHELKQVCTQTCFVMVSQVTDKDLISKAYLAGVDFFISKPINVIEVVSVLNQVRDKRRMQGIIQSLRVAIGASAPAQDQPGAVPGPSSQEELRRQLRGIFSRLGILGESGSDDIVEICLLYLQQKKQSPPAQVRMSELYATLAQQYHREQGTRINAASVEQRIRRALNKALNNIANIGIEDYDNDFFVSFGSSFFDFTEVRRQMNYIRGSSDTPGKINVKKFMEGLATVLENGR